MVLHTRAFTLDGTFTVPPGITKLRVFGIGGGGSGGGGAFGVGGGGSSFAGAGGGGGGGAIGRQELISITPSTLITVVVATSRSGGLGSTTVAGTNASDGYDGYSSSIGYGMTSISFKGAEGGKGGRHGQDAGGTSFVRGGYSTALASTTNVPTILAASNFTGTTGMLFVPRLGQGGWGLPQDLASSSYTAYMTGGDYGTNLGGTPGFTTGVNNGGAGGGGGSASFSYMAGFQSFAGAGGSGGTDNSTPGTAGGNGLYGGGGGGGGGGYGSPTSGGSNGGNGGAGGAGLIVITWET